MIVKKWENPLKQHPIFLPFRLQVTPPAMARQVAFSFRPNKPEKPMTPHLLRYQGFAVVYDGFALDALDLGHPRLSLNLAGNFRLQFFFKDFTCGRHRQ